MPNDLNIGTSTFTRLAMLLQYKEGISEQWIEKLVENTGFNRWFPSRLADQLTPGSSPAPSVDGEDVGGGAIQVWESKTTGSPSASLVDSSLDWRNRFLVFVGFLTTDSTQQTHWGGNSMEEDGWFRIQDDSAAPLDYVRGLSGSRLLSLAAWYGAPGTTSAPLYSALDPKAVDASGNNLGWNFWPDATSGNLYGIPSPSSAITNRKSCSGIIFYGTQTGHQMS